jgi:hypothetical protein
MKTSKINLIILNGKLNNDQQITIYIDVIRNVVIEIINNETKNIGFIEDKYLEYFTKDSSFVFTYEVNSKYDIKTRLTNKTKYFNSISFMQALNKYSYVGKFYKVDLTLQHIDFCKPDKSIIKKMLSYVR